MAEEPVDPNKKQKPLTYAGNDLLYNNEFGRLSKFDYSFDIIGLAA